MAKARIEKPKWRWAVIIAASIKKNCGKRNLVFALDKEFLHSIAPDFCPVLGVKLNYNNPSIKSDSPSVDRYDNSVGYIKSNVNVISAKANMMKNNGTLEDVEKLYYWMKKIEHGE